MRSIGLFQLLFKMRLCGVALIDCVQASKSLSKKKSDKLINKLGTLRSKYETDALKRTLLDNPQKVKSENLYRNKTLIQRAIDTKRFISFHYDKGTRFLEGNIIEEGDYWAYPVEIVYTGDAYYLLGVHARANMHKAGSVLWRPFEHEVMIFFRIDYISKLKMVRTDDIGTLMRKCRDYGKEFQKDPIKSRYEASRFLWEGGLVGMDVTIKFDNRVKEYVLIDLGEDINIVHENDDNFVIREPMAINQGFFKWFVSYGDEAELVHPLYVAHSIKGVLKNLYSTYEELAEISNAIDFGEMDDEDREKLDNEDFDNEETEGFF